MNFIDKFDTKWPFLPLFQYTGHLVNGVIKVDAV